MEPSDPANPTPAPWKKGTVPYSVLRSGPFDETRGRNEVVTAHRPRRRVGRREAEGRPARGPGRPRADGRVRGDVRADGRGGEEAPPAHADADRRPLARRAHDDRVRGPREAAGRVAPRQAARGAPRTRAPRLRGALLLLLVGPAPPARRRRPPPVQPPRVRGGGSAVRAGRADGTVAL